jgi:ArsR family transcriptional regulator, arsenate/arsenite/antimonite-responsive transcriptional repressor
MPKPLALPESPTLASGLCCTPLVSAPLSTEEATELSGRLKALSDPTRLRMLSLMMANSDLEACTCDLTDELGLTQPTISFHLKKLTQAGVCVADRRVGTYTYYRVVPEALAGLAAVLAPVG